MGKFKTGLVREINREIAYKNEQAELKEKHNIEDENVVVVEKPSLGKFILKCVIGFIKLLASAILILLAAVGLLTLIYPAPRLEVCGVILEIWDSIMNMI